MAKGQLCRGYRISNKIGACGVDAKVEFGIGSMQLTDNIWFRAYCGEV